MAEVVLDEPQVVLLVGEREAAVMTQRVRVDAGQVGACRGGCDEVVHRLAGERLFALGDEQPGQRVGAGGQVAPEGARFVTGNRLLDREAALKTAHPEPGAAA